MATNPFLDLPEVGERNNPFLDLPEVEPLPDSAFGEFTPQVKFNIDLPDNPISLLSDNPPEMIQNPHPPETTIGEDIKDLGVKAGSGVLDTLAAVSDFTRPDPRPPGVWGVEQAVASISFGLGKFFDIDFLEEFGEKKGAEIARQFVAEDLRREKAGEPSLEEERQSQFGTQAADFWKNKAREFSEKNLSKKQKSLDKQLSIVVGKGAWETAKFIAENPSIVLSSFAESLPAMLFAGGAGRVGKVIAGRAGGVVGSIGGETSVASALNAQQAQQVIDQIPDDKLLELPEAQSILTLNPDAGTETIRSILRDRASNTTFASSLMTNVLVLGASQKLGMNVVQDVFAGTRKKTADGIIKRGFKGYVGESAQEYPQEYLDAISGNLGEIATGTKLPSELTEGAGGSGVLGAAAGGPAGGAMSIISGGGADPSDPGGLNEGGGSFLEGADDVSRLENITTEGINKIPGVIDRIEQNISEQDARTLQNTQERLDRVGTDIEGSGAPTILKQTTAADADADDETARRNLSPSGGQSESFDAGFKAADETIQDNEEQAEIDRLAADLDKAFAIPLLADNALITQQQTQPIAPSISLPGFEQQTPVEQPVEAPIVEKPPIETPALDETESISQNLRKLKQQPGRKFTLSNGIGDNAETFEIDTLKDDILTLLAKRGGLNRDDWIANGIDPEVIKDRKLMNRIGAKTGMPFGKPLLRAKGGMTTDDVAEFLMEQVDDKSDFVVPREMFDQYGRVDANDALQFISEIINGTRDGRYVDAIEREANINEAESALSEIEQNKLIPPEYADQAEAGPAFEPEDYGQDFDVESKAYVDWSAAVLATGNVFAVDEIAKKVDSGEITVAQGVKELADTLAATPEISNEQDSEGINPTREEPAQAGQAAETPDAQAEAEETPLEPAQSEQAPLETEPIAEKEPAEKPDQQDTVLFDRTIEEPFYSDLNRTVEAAEGMPKKGSPELFKKWLDGKQGLRVAKKQGKVDKTTGKRIEIGDVIDTGGEFKAEERDWMGVDEWLDSQESVTRAELQQFVADNQVKIQEVTKGDTNKINRDSKYALPEVLKVVELYQGQADEALLLTLENDGDAYRAVMKKFPELEGNEDWAEVVANDVAGGFENAVDTKFEAYVLPGGKKYRELLLTLPTSNLKGGWGVIDADGYINERFDTETEAKKAAAESEGLSYDRVQPSGGLDTVYTGGHYDEPNVLAHIRFNERTGPNGERILFIEEIQSDWHQEGRKEGYQDVNDGDVEAWWTDEGGANEEVDFGDLTPSKQNEARSRYKDEAPYGERSVPNAPFQKSWPMLAMKRMLRYAAENGFDSVAWTTGEQQADRYDLSKQLDGIGYEKRGDSLYNITAFGKGGGEVWNNQSASLDIIENNLGKEIAKRVENNEGSTELGNETVKYLSGLDLKVGGEGMKSFYDRLLVNETNKFVKKWGGRVGESAIMLNKDYSPDDVKSMGDLGMEIALDKGEATLVHNLPITDSMRESASGGLPLFANALDIGFGTKSVSQTGGRITYATKQLEGAMARYTGEEILPGTYLQVDTPKSAAADVHAVKKMFGKRVAFFRTAKKVPFRFNGVTLPRDPKTLYVNIDSKNPFMGVVGHELTHALQIQYPKLYKELADTARQHLKDGGQAEFADRLNAKIKSNKADRVLSDEKVYDEMVANVVGDAFLDPAFISKLAAKDVTLVQRILNAFTKILNSFKSKAKSAGMGSGKYFNNIQALIDRVQATLEEFDSSQSAVKATGREAAVFNEKQSELLDEPTGQDALDIKRNEVEQRLSGKDKTPTAPEEGKGELFKQDPTVRGQQPLFSQSPRTQSAYEKRIDAIWNEEPRRALVRVLDKSDVLGLLGHEGKPVIAYESKIDKIFDKHNLTPEHLKKIPEWIENPVAVFESEENKNKLIFVAPEAVADSQIMVVVEPDGAGLEASLLVTAYDKSGQGYMQKWTNKGLLRFIRTKKKPLASGTERLQWPKVIPHLGRGSKTRILTDSDLVKYRANAGVEENPLFMREQKLDFNPEFSNYSLPTQKLADAMRDDSLNLVDKALKGTENLRLNARQFVQDKMIPVRRIQEAIEESGGTVSEFADIYEKEQLLSGRVEDRFKQMEAEDLAPLISWMGKSDISRQTLGKYLYARHAESRNERIAKINEKFPDGGSGMKTAEAKRILKEFDKQKLTPALEKMAGYVDRITQKTRDNFRDYGLIDTAVMDEWERGGEFNDTYVPLRGFADAMQEEFGRPGKGFDIRGTEVQRALGRKSKAGDILGNVLSSYKLSVIRGEKNRVGQALLRLAQDNPNENLWKINPVTMKTVIDKETGMTTERADMQMNDPNVFFTKLNGKAWRIELRDKRLAVAMKNLGADNMNAFFRAISTSTRYLSLTRTMLSPEFIITNFMRDIQTAGINLTAEQGSAIRKASINRKAITHSIRAMFNEQRGGKKGDPEWRRYAREYTEDGGRVAFFRAESVEELARKVDRMSRMTGDDAVAVGYRGLKATFELIEDMNLGVENAVRLSAYKASRENGMSRQKAAVLAKNLTVNFNRKGLAGPWVNAFYMFANASVQGAQRMLQASKNPRVQKVLLESALFGALMTFYNQLAGGEDDDGESFYSKIQPFEKSRKFILMIPDGLNDAIRDIPFMNFADEDKKRGAYLTITLPYGYSIPYVMGEAIGSTAFGTEPTDAALNIVMAINNSFNPVGGSGTWTTIAPTLADPFVELAQNKNFWGGTIHKQQSPYDNTPAPKSGEGFRNTGAAYKWVAEKLNEWSGGTDIRPGNIDFNPETYRHLLEFLVGGTGSFAERVVDNVSAAINPKRDVDINRVPFLRQFFGTTRSFADVDRYYANITELGYLEKERKAYQIQVSKGEMRRDRYDQWAEDRKEMFPLIYRSKAAEKEIKGLRKRLKSERLNDPLSDESKQLEKRILDRQFIFNTQYNKVMLDKGWLRSVIDSE